MAMEAMQEALPERVSGDWQGERGLAWRDGGCEREWPGENGQANSFARGEGWLGMKERDWRERQQPLQSLIPGAFLLRRLEAASVA